MPDKVPCSPRYFTRHFFISLAQAANEDDVSMHRIPGRVVAGLPVNGNRRGVVQLNCTFCSYSHEWRMVTDKLLP